MAIAGFANLAMGEWFGGVPIESLLALVTIPARSRVATILADSAGDALRKPKDFHIEAALTGVLVAVALFALIGFLGGGSGPWTIEVEWLAAFAIPSSGIVAALAVQLPTGVRGTLGGVSIALAPSAHRKVRDGIVQSTAGCCHIPTEIRLNIIASGSIGQGHTVLAAGQIRCSSGFQ